MDENQGASEVSSDVGNDGGGGDDHAFDMKGATDSISADLFGNAGEDTGSDAGDEADDVAKSSDEKTTNDDDESRAETNQSRPAPQSWKKDMHEKYAALPPEVQEYIVEREEQMRAGLEKDRGDANLGRVMRDVMTPYRQMLQEQGVDEPRAVQALMNAHYKLSTSNQQEKVQMLATIARQYGIAPEELIGGESAPVDPAIKALQDELNGIKSHLNAGQRDALLKAKERTSHEVEMFATDPSHPYFDEVADEIVAFLHQGNELNAAYEKAVWANPVTRQKEIERLKQEQENSFREKSKQEVEAARKAASNTVRNRDTRRVPTEPKGSMKDLDGSLRDTLREIKNRTH